MQVTIKFKINKNVYNQYEGILQEFLNYINDIRAEDIEVKEDE